MLFEYIKKYIWIKIPKMKNYYLALLLLAPFFSNAQIVNIPDANFKQKLLLLGIDTNNDQEIQVSEAAAVQGQLLLDYAYISDLTGIEAFTGIDYLSFMQNQVTTVDLSALTNLRELWCADNNLTSLNLYGLDNLEVLECAGNELTDLDVSFLPQLKKLYCDDNQLTSLYVLPLTSLEELTFCGNEISYVDMSTLTNLQQLRVAENPYPVLDLTPFPNLISLKCYSCGLTALDLSAVPNLFRLQCGDNPLSTLDVSSLTHLYDLDAPVCGLASIDLSGLTELSMVDLHYNNLTTLDLSHQTSLNSLDVGYNDLSTVFMKNGRDETLLISNNPNLAYICADDSQITAVQSQLNTLGMDATVCNSYCSFSPGGNYNTISGHAGFDSDGNGCDGSDFQFPLGKFKINDGSADLGSATTNAQGNYVFYTMLTENHIIPDIENPAWFDFSPVEADVNFPDTNNNVSSQDFCITANGIHSDVEVVILPGVTRPGFDTVFHIIYRNKGNQVQSGTVGFSYDDSVLDYISASTVPNLFTTGNLEWDYANLLPFESRSIEMTFNANGPTETQPLNIGDVLTYTAVINPVSGDELPVDNTFSLSQVVVGSHDPNNKICLEGAIVPVAKIGDYLHYVVNFENNGTFPAENIVVSDVLDADKFDLSSLQVLGSSHPSILRQSGSKAEFIFEDIGLQPNEYGYVAFKIKTKNTLMVGDSVTNKADIFFDYNFPVETNGASLTFEDLGVGGFDVGSVRLYPNPAGNNVTVETDALLSSIGIYDFQGRAVAVFACDGNSSALDISHLGKGIYFLKITTSKGSGVRKIVKE